VVLKIRKIARVRDVANFTEIDKARRLYQ